jgi:hypothetical protein
VGVDVAFWLDGLCNLCFVARERPPAGRLSLDRFTLRRSPSAVLRDPQVLTSVLFRRRISLFLMSASRG